MSLLFEKFYRGLRWNTLEAVIYQGSLLGHQIALFKAISPSLYGVVGTLFSLTYLIIAVSNLGLDATLAPFFTTLLSSKYSFRKILLPNIAPGLLFLGAIGLGIPLILSLLTISLSDPYVGIIIGLLALCEGIQKTLRTILQLAFYNKITALVDSIRVLSYIAAIWSLYGIGYELTIYLIFMPMLISSLCAMIIFGHYVYHLYTQLPESSSEPLEKTIPHRFRIARFFNFLNQMSHLIFSSNFLVPFFAMQFGFDIAGLFKLISSSAHSITILINKIFGHTTEALLAQVKEMDLTTKRAVFAKITSNIYQTLYAIIIFFVINHTVILSSQRTQVDTPWLLMSLFFIVHLSEYFFMAYEKFYITHEKTAQLFCFTLITTAALMVGLRAAMGYGPLAILITMLTIRVISFLGIGTLSFYTWQIKPNLTMQPYFFISSLVIACTFFMLSR